MSAQWFVYVLLVGTMLALVARSLDAIARQRGLSTRWIWLGAMAATALFAWFAPSAAQSVVTDGAGSPVQWSITPSVPVDTRFTLVQRLEQARASVEIAVVGSLTALSARLPQTAVATFASLWLAVTATLLSLIAIVHLRVERAKRAWPRTDIDGTDVRVAPSVGPVVIGLSTPEIVLPRWLLSRDREERRIVIAHEREHVVARDQLLPFAGWLVAAMLPWHPAVWWMLSRLRLAIELDCDGRVLRRHHVHPRSYGELLIDIAGHCTPFRLGALALADGPSHLERRLLAMKTTRTRFSQLRTAAFAIVALSAFVVACESRVPTSAEIEKMDVAEIEKSAAAQILETKIDAVKYYVDGVQKSPTAAHAIPSREIATMEVVKGVENEIHITTKLRLAKEMQSKLNSADGKVAIAYTKDGQTETRELYIRPDGVEMEKREAGERPFTVKADQITLQADKLTLRPVTKDDFRGVVLLDGVEVSLDKVGKLDRATIDAIEVIKGSAATAMSSNPRAALGIISVRTKK